MAVVNLGWQDGRRRRKYLYAPTRQEVQKKLTKALHDHNRGIPLPNDQQTVEAYLDLWLVGQKTAVRPSTYISYEAIVRLHLKPGLKGIRLGKLTVRDVQGLLEKKEADPNLSPRRVAMIRGVLRQALNEAVKQETLSRNVAALAKSPKAERHEIEPFTPQEAAKFLEATRGNRLEALFSVVLALGLRRGEALGLQWSDVDLDKATLTVRHALQRISGQGLVLTKPKSESSLRTIALPLFAVTALRKHRLRQNEERLLAGSKWRDSGHIFTTTIGTALDPDKITKTFKSILKKAGLRDQRFHDLRHCCATLLLAQGLPPRLIMETLGHSQISLTMNTYSHVSPAFQREAASAMEGLLGGQNEQ